jgi:capsular polysaccharide biosynthesis protein
MKTIVRSSVYVEYSNVYERLNPHVHSTPPNREEQREIIRQGTRLYKCAMPAVQIVRPQGVDQAVVCKMTQKDAIGAAMLSIFKFQPTILEQHDLYYMDHRIQKVILQMESMKTHKYNEYIVAYNPWSSNIFHFVTEQLPSILFMNGELGKPNVPILCISASFLQPLLQFFGVTNPIQLISGPYKWLPQVDCIYEQPYIECGAPSPQKINLLRTIVLAKLQFAEQRIGILIRRKEIRRSLMNHAELLDLLQIKRPDLEWIVFDSQPFDECVDIFSRAQLVVAPHGAGLTNMLFSPPKTRIIELMPSINPNLCYYHLAALLHFDHCIIPCDQFPNFSMTAPLDIIGQMNMGNK